MLRGLLKLIVGIVLTIVALVVAGNVFFPERMAQFAAAAERGAAGLERKEIDIPGFHIVYLDGGQGDPLVLVHGFGADKDNWTRVAKYLTPHFRVIAPDLPGFGESSKPDSAHYSQTDQVQYLRAFVQALQLQNVSLGGNSMGGHIVGLYAATFPGEVKTLWLVAPAGVSTAELSELGALIKAGQPNPLLARTPEEFDRIVHFVMTDPPYIPGSIKKVLAQRAAANYELHSRIFQELLAAKPEDALEPRLKGNPVPTRILWGDRDRALSVTGAKILGGLLPHSSVTVMPGVGHLPMIEKPRAAAEDYLAFRAAVK
jgi:pimeloyl-ACP methyl ester carboxylesterase